MKRLLFLSCFMLFSFILSCNNESEIESTTRRFLEGYYSLNIKDIKDISSENTLVKLNEIESRLGDNVGASSIPLPIIEIHEYYEEGDIATCRYTLKESNDDGYSMSEQLTLVKKSGKWLVEF